MKTNALKTPVFAVSLLAGLTLLLASCGNSAPPAEKTYTLTVSNLCPISVNVFIDNSAKGIFAPAQARDYTLTQGAHSIKAVPSGGGTPSVVVEPRTLQIEFCPRPY